MCELCGMYKSITSRLFQYDNGEQVSLAVCERCVTLHNRTSRIYDGVGCAKCKTVIHPLAVFPKGLCVDCHALNFVMPTAKELTEMWGGVING